MTDLSAQKRLASDVLDVGESRVWFDPDAQGAIAEAITREDIRELVEDGSIREEAKKGNSPRPRPRAQSEARLRAPNRPRHPEGEVGRSAEREGTVAANDPSTAPEAQGTPRRG